MYLTACVHRRESLRVLLHVLTTLALCVLRLSCRDTVASRVRAVVAAHPDTMRLEQLSAELNGCVHTASSWRRDLVEQQRLTLRLPTRYAAAMDVVTVDFTAGRVPPERQLRVWLNFGEHGRELVTTDVAVRLLDVLARGPDAAAAFARGGRGAASALRRTVFKVVPLENGGGRAKVEGGELCLRKNGRGVDPNRNWDIHWGVKEKDYDPYEEAAGAAPFSEPESLLLRDALAAWEPHAWVNVHSGMRALFMPFDHVAAMPGGPGGDAMRKMLEALKRGHCPDCVTGGGGGAVGYLAHGTATDYVFSNLSVPVAMTWEIYGDSTASNNDCFRMFNPLGREQHDALLDAWAAACIAVPSVLTFHPDVPPDMVAWGRKGGPGVSTGTDTAWLAWVASSALLVALLLTAATTSGAALRRWRQRQDNPEAAVTKQMV